MKRMLTISRMIWLCTFLVIAGSAIAQTVAIDRVAMSPRLLGTYTGFPVSTGLRTVPIGMKVYLLADTVGSGATPVTSYTWSIPKKPATSAAAIDTPSARFVRFIPDVAGQYIVSVAVNGGKTASDTLYASSFAGVPATGLSCTLCHAAIGTEWSKTNHATIYTRGITGQLEVEAAGPDTLGVYNTSCARCHTTGWEPNVNNGNYGYLAKTTGWDTTWYKAARPWAGEYLIPFKSMTIFNNMTQNFPTVTPMATIGCESCHGPGKDHANNGGNKTMISRSVEAGACMVCHDAPNKHRLGSYWAASSHSNLRLSASEASRSSCWPCHNGDAFVAYCANKTTPDYSKTKVLPSVACATCHDPHNNTNEKQLRTVTLPALANGYVPPAGAGGMGQLCMNCHRARTNSVTVIAGMQRVYANRFYPHYSPQADMFLGSNAAEYGLPITGLMTHASVENGCVTCHMATRTIGSSVLANHEMLMTDAAGKDIVTACKECHGEDIEEFNDVRAFYDYDGNGRIEGVITEVDGLLDRLKAILPKNAAGEVTTSNADSAIVKADKNWPNNLPAIWNYHFVKNDWSHGVHNTKYTVAILRASLGNLTGVEVANQDVPSTFTMGQNYPNPFNPSTQISFSLPIGADAQLHVFNNVGQLVKTLAGGQLAPGNYTVTWNGTDNNGQAAASGVYFYRFTASVNGSVKYNLTRKMVLTK